MFGGADPAIEGLVPSDIDMRHNHLAKPLRWRTGTPGCGRHGMDGEEPVRAEERAARAH